MLNVSFDNAWVTSVRPNVPDCLIMASAYAFASNASDRNSSYSFHSYCVILLLIIHDGLRLVHTNIAV